MPKIIGGSLEEHRERTREKIFAALGELMATDPFEDITFSRIAEEAQVGRTAMYNHFPDKDTLLVEYTMHETSDYLDQLQEGIRGASTPIEAIELYVRTQLGLSSSFHLSSTRGRVNLDPEIARRMREHVVLIERVLSSILEEGIATGDFAADLDIEATLRIINAMLIGRDLPKGTDETELVRFIQRAVGAKV
ncbi:TetR/AcrR family transcriptional regulator [Brachybacterium endophyticum]|uniref:TetR/AcrR family transcriptional regulator n=1 Tax=Brachybacterium endophyticum TaxID=2182385 RepID=A0A2U2RMC8_9MICO|nr:TetR/AcrR family transcriptional regulator [Brachybacterium endophyticum]PWH07023.1 TetR/AcrR family transcriptional regulator [Brachybacterium endophyticum]